MNGSVPAKGGPSNAPGSLSADIVAVKGDVLRDIGLLKHIDLIMKGGVVYKQDGKIIEERF